MDGHVHHMLTKTTQNAIQRARAGQW